ncbi:adenosylcobinamide-GDP ribazoletransferase [Granulicella sibirica]|uniref:Adenosylcobinamide-GDP ribazoletransferase n=1 Tax=Granulicella sibirica TaxID=2479048 RepID=A0A4V1L5T8_9BACT|nr:adenosylcobinamide-GDP ribazoletransferase [Granulicella sibirica]RXH56914.1 Cobalamin synthase [Granulicella sibirica]
MTTTTLTRRPWTDLVVAIQFLTRVPTPRVEYSPDALARSVMWFPLVGLLIGGSAALVAHLLTPHVARPVVALAIVFYLILLTGALHEDGLADAADAFGGGWTRDRILAILRDSRIGSYGAIALIVSLAARVLLLGTMPPGNVVGYLIAAHVLCRWTTLPLSTFLPAARAESDGQGARLARRTTLTTLYLGSALTLLIVGITLRLHSIAPILAVAAIAVISARFYQYKIKGVTGDCFGATNQLAEIAVYLCGAWIA